MSISGYHFLMFKGVFVVVVVVVAVLFVGFFGGTYGPLEVFSCRMHSKSSSGRCWGLSYDHFPCCLPRSLASSPPRSLARPSLALARPSLARRITGRRRKRCGGEQINAFRALSQRRYENIRYIGLYRATLGNTFEPSRLMNFFCIPLG